MTLHRTCPKCGFDKCWVKARKCENCLFNFLTEKAAPEPVVVEVEEDKHLWLMLTPRRKVKLRQEQYDDMLAKMRHFVEHWGNTPDDAAALAVHQMRLLVWIEQNPLDKRKERRNRGVRNNE